MTAIYNSLTDARRAYARGRRYLLNQGNSREPSLFPAHIREKLNGSLMHHTKPPSPRSARFEMARDRRRARAKRIMQAMVRVLAAKKERQP